MIMDHWKGHLVVNKANQLQMINGQHYKKKTMAGWELEVEWKDGSMSWLSLKELKNSNPIKLAKYAQDNRLMEEPAFNWWASHVLKKCNQLIKAVHHVHQKKNFKYGLRRPVMMKEALEIDEANGETFWHDAIDKEMSNVLVTFDIKEEGAMPPPGYKCIPLHMVFDVKMDFM